MTAAVVAIPTETRVFRPVVVLVLLLAGVFSFSAYVVLQAYAPDLKGGDDGGAQVLSHSAVGFAGMVRLLEAENAPVLINRDPPAKRGPNWGLLVLTPEETTKPSDLFDFTTASGPTLIVLPKWETLPDPLNSGWVKSAGLIDHKTLEALLARRVSATVARRTGAAPVQLTQVEDPGRQPVPTGPIDHLQTLAAPGMTTVLTDQAGAALLVRTADARLYVLSDPDLLNTQGLGSLVTAKAGTDLLLALRQGDGPIVFDVTLDGVKHSQSLLKLAFEPPFLGATLCLLAAALLMALHAASRFGAPRQSGQALALGKLALAENSAGLIRMARREPSMAGGYLDLSRGAVTKALGATRLSGAELDAYLNRLGERTDAGCFSALAAEGAAVKDRDGLTRFAQRLYQWRVEMTRERR
ncbi:MAG TPA: DUF4350 domain-containing protein [Caulobacteraceae bacterium]|jgi:hypothetical protein|nr:DUF4350 domain-containing protein [Caulobacteraceae bacterium]